jgi:Lon protease-like protein
VSGSTPDRVVLPMFPLPDITFFPHMLLPLHIFEARYRALVADVLARDRRLCIAQLQPGYEAGYAGRPAVRGVAGAGEIVKWERLPTGRYNILVKGETRVRIEAEHPSDTLYRIAVGRRLEDIAPRDDLSAARERIRATCRRLLLLLKRSPDLLDGALADDHPPGVVADRVAAAVIPDPSTRQRLLETVDVGDRLALLGNALKALVDELQRRGGD